MVPRTIKVQCRLRMKYCKNATIGLKTSPNYYSTGTTHGQGGMGVYTTLKLDNIALVEYWKENGYEGMRKQWRYQLGRSPLWTRWRSQSCNTGHANPRDAGIYRYIDYVYIAPDPPPRARAPPPTLFFPLPLPLP